MTTQDDIEEMFIHEVSVQTYKGTGSWGDTYDPSVSVPCFLDNQTQLTRDTDGTEVVSTATVFAPLSKAGLFAVGSLVSLPGRQAQVIGCNARDGSKLDLPSHVEVTLT